MNNADILLMLKANLEKATTSQDTYLNQLLDVAFKAIQEEGINIEKIASEVADYEIEDIQDVNLMVMYAAYLFRKRADEGSPQMPRMLRYALNNRLFSQKMKESTDAS